MSLTKSDLKQLEKMMQDKITLNNDLLFARIVDAMRNFVTRDELEANYVKKDEIQEIKADISGIKSDVAAIRTDLEALTVFNYGFQQKTSLDISNIKKHIGLQT